MDKIVRWLQEFPPWIAGLNDREVTVILVCLVGTVVVGSVLFIRSGGRGR